jgi:hydroxymethylbilane synthase
MKIIFATRPSALARWQTAHVIHLLQAAHPGLECSEYIITTKGDRVLDRPLPEIGGKGLFTSELENALLSGEVHAAVHSLKDLPVEDTPGIVVAAIPEREAAHDVLVSANGYTLSNLPEGARVGTCSLRRTAQLLCAASRSHNPAIARQCRFTRAKSVERRIRRHHLGASRIDKARIASTYL